jgi:hypothetical protein
MRTACNPDSGWKSGFCSVCVAQGLFSYQKVPGGVCVCSPLTIGDDVCAGNQDQRKIVSAIVAADSECAKYTLAAPDAGQPEMMTQGGAAGDTASGGNPPTL